MSETMEAIDAQIDPDQDQAIRIFHASAAILTVIAHAFQHDMEEEQAVQEMTFTMPVAEPETVISGDFQRLMQGNLVLSSGAALRKYRQRTISCEFCSGCGSFDKNPCYPATMTVEVDVPDTDRMYHKVKSFNCVNVHIS